MEERKRKIVIYSLVQFISAVPQDLKFGGEDSLAIIGDNCTIRECVTINREQLLLAKQLWVKIAW
jgi:acyl-[acyl carrier protein]--UDP-N-acetylglucosamine O-acyltransferase